MKFQGHIIWSRCIKHLTATGIIVLVAACSFNNGTGGRLGSGLRNNYDSPYAPGINKRGKSVGGLEVGHRLMAAGEYDLALDAFSRALLEEGPTAEVYSSLGSANLGLGRLGQAEDLLRRAVKIDPNWPEALNNLGIVLLERDKTAEAEQVLRRAFALDNGESDAIRDNLRLALVKLDNSTHSDPTSSDYKLVQYGGGFYRIQQTP